MKRGYRVVVMLAGLAGAVACSQTAIGPNLGLPSSSISRERSASSIHRFDHVVILIQENRSFDNFFATYPGADGATYGYDHLGHKVYLKKSVLAFENLSHSHFSFVKEYDHGKMDGFDLVKRNSRKTGFKVPAHHYAYRYVDPSYIQPYWTLAQQYVLADHMFPTQSSGSFTGHQDLIAGGTEVEPGKSVIDFPTGGPWGCDAAGGTVTSLITTTGNYLRDKGPFPCFSYPTLRDVLDAGQISWRYFVPAETFGAGRAWDAFDGIRVVRYGPEWKSNVINPPTQIFKAIQDGWLPAVSWLVPDALESDHPGDHIRDRGPSWVANVIDAIGESPYWNSTAIVVVWDDWGGEFDHVAPPQLDGQGLGFRVPCLIVAPYARRGYVSHTQYEFGSILRFIEDNWNLKRLGTSDKRAASIIDAFDFSHGPRQFIPIKAGYSKSYFLAQPPSRLPLDTE